MSDQDAPGRNRQKMPFGTRLSSARFSPRTFVASSGWITAHSKSVKSNRAMLTTCFARNASRIGQPGAPIYGSVTQKMNTTSLHETRGTSKPRVTKCCALLASTGDPCADRQSMRPFSEGTFRSMSSVRCRFTEACDLKQSVCRVPLGYFPGFYAWLHHASGQRAFGDPGLTDRLHHSYLIHASMAARFVPAHWPKGQCGGNRSKSSPPPVGIVLAKSNALRAGLSYLERLKDQ
jgi:hypothetical protein